MIIQVHKKEDNKLARIIISVVIIITVSLYYVYHITYKTHEDNKAFELKVENISKEKKKSRRIQRQILNEAEKIIYVVGADNIDKIKYTKNYLNIFTKNSFTTEPLLVRYGTMAKIQKSNNTWLVKLDLQKLLILKQEEK